MNNDIFEQLKAIAVNDIGIDADNRMPEGHNLHHNSSFCWRGVNLRLSMECMAHIALDYMTQ